MEVILLERIENLGALGEIVSVRAGYARNFLVPKKKAKMATKANLVEFETIRAELEAAEAVVVKAAEARKAELDNITVTITANSGTEGKLFGSVSPADIAEALVATGAKVERSEVRMPEGPIRDTGEHAVDIHLLTGIDATIKVIVIGDGEISSIIEEEEEEEKTDADATPEYEEYTAER
ncbi:MAG: 50S ribosomal protein L9 [Thiotrichaceae bacterium]|nr:50S ribosomal protein L9 [Thiotrichaceae bacterium]